MWAGQVKGKWHSWAHCADERGSNTFLVWPPSVSVYPTSADRSPLLLSFYCWWWVSGGCLLYATIRPLSHTYHSPCRHQYSHDPLNQPHSATQANPDYEICIINIFFFKGVRIWRPSAHHPLTHQPHALNASPQLVLFVLEAPDWESMVELGFCQQGQHTRTSWPIKTIHQPSLIYLFLSLYLIWQLNHRQTKQEARYTLLTFLLSCEMWDSMFFCQYWPSRRMSFLLFLISIETRQSGKWHINAVVH